MRVRDYSQWKHEDEIHMNPGDLHEPLNPPGEYSSELESALNRVAQQDVAPMGGPRGRLPNARGG